MALFLGEGHRLEVRIQRGEQLVRRAQSGGALVIEEQIAMEAENAQREHVLGQRGFVQDALSLVLMAREQLGAVDQTLNQHISFSFA